VEIKHILQGPRAQYINVYILWVHDQTCFHETFLEDFNCLNYLYDKYKNLNSNINWIVKCVLLMSLNFSTE